MAQFVGPSISQLPGWRIGILFIIFFTIAMAWDRGSRALDRYLKRHRKRGLRHVVRRLEQELLVLGLFSLLLVAFEEYLLKICIPCSASCSWDCPGQGGGRRRRNLLAPAIEELSCLVAVETCSPGSEPFWSQLALIQAHIFIFVIAAVHILYACVSMLLCMWKLRRWQRFEEHALNHELQPLSSRFMPRPGDNTITHTLRCTVSMLTHSVNAEVYCGLRRLFIERLDVDPSFSFWGFLVESMEEEFSQVVGINALLWLLVLVWIMLPPESYQLIWLSALVVTSVLIVAVKLQSIIITLAQEAYRLYGNRSVHKPPRGMLQSMKVGLHRMSPFSGAFRMGAQVKTGIQNRVGAISNGLRDAPDGLGSRNGHSCAVQGEDSSMSHQHQQHWQQQRQHPEQRSVHRAEAVANAEAAAALQAADSLPSPIGSVSDDSSSEEDEEIELQGAAQASQTAVGAAAPPMAAAAAGAAAAEAIQGIAAPDVDKAAYGGDALHMAHTQQWQQRQLQSRAGQLSFDVEAQQQPLHSASSAAADASSEPKPSGGSSSSVFRRCWPWRLPRWPRQEEQQTQSRTQALRRSQSFADTYRGPDAASLFWFGKPRILLRIIQFIYFENSLSVAAVLFSLWQGVEFDWSRYGGWPFLGTMIGVELVLLVFLSLKVLPVYALTTAAGSHSAASVIQLALKKNIKPDIAKALQRMSMEMPGAREAEEQDEGGASSAAAQSEGICAPGMPPEEVRDLHGEGRAAGAPSAPFGSWHVPLGISPETRVTAVRLSDWRGSPEPFKAAHKPHEDENEQDQLSITRLMGAMYERQVRRHLERASGSRAPPTSIPSLSRHSMGAPMNRSGWTGLQAVSTQQPQASNQDGAPGDHASTGRGRAEQEECPDAVETCPAAVGAGLQQQMQAQLRAKITEAGNVPGEAAATPAASPVPADVRKLARLSSHPTLRHVRGLFDPSEAEDAGNSTKN